MTNDEWRMTKVRHVAARVHLSFLQASAPRGANRRTLARTGPRPAGTIGTADAMVSVLPSLRVSFSADCTPGSKTAGLLSDRPCGAFATPSVDACKKMGCALAALLGWFCPVPSFSRTTAQDNFTLALRDESMAPRLLLETVEYHQTPRSQPQDSQCAQARRARDATGFRRGVRGSQNLRPAQARRASTTIAVGDESSRNPRITADVSAPRSGATNR